MTATTPTRTAPAASEDEPGVTRRHRPADFYHERTNFQFIKHTRRWAILSGTFVLLSVVFLFARGLNFGIDFEGGSSWQVQMAHGRTAHVADVRDILRPLGFSDAKVSILSGRNTQKVNVQAHVLKDPVQEVRDTLATYGKVTPADVEFKQPDKPGDSFTFTFTAKKGVTPSEAAINRALSRTELRGQSLKIAKQEIVVSAATLPVSATDKVANALAKYAGTDQNGVSISTVGPTWGREVSRKALQALIYFFILLAVYLSVRFEAKMSAAAIIAVIHDIIFTVGVYALFHFEVTPATITAFLTILGFSLYDTVVVFDKVRENQRVLTATGRSTYSEMVNKSLNQVLMRSLSTSFVALMPVLSLLIVGSVVFGATSLENFALALAAGLFIGSYSSIFVAAPILAWWKEREPQYRALAERRRRTPAPSSPLSPSSPSSPSNPSNPSLAAAMATVAAPAASREPAGLEPDAVSKMGVGVPGPPAVGRTIQPRARQQRRRKRK